MKIVAFKTGKPRQYKYRPVFYNKEKEEMEERLKELTRESSDTEELEVEKFRSKIRNAWSNREVKAKQMPNKTFYIYLVAVLALIYYIFFR